MSKQRTKQRIYTAEDVALHNNDKSCWVIANRKVFDVTSFMHDHPGGDELILGYAGKDVQQIMEDPSEHSHSDSAFDLMREFQIGIVGNLETTCSEDTKVDENFSPEQTAADDDYARNQFLDLNKPLVMQIFRSNFSKSFYLHQVHQPRYLPGSARFFGPSALEMLTRTNWWVVPMVWLPISAYIFYKSLVQQGSFDAASQSIKVPGMAWMQSAAFFVLGNFIWTLLEYTFHRFLFHVEEILPDHPYALAVHFLMHGVHHYLPCDKLRLVMPPLLFFLLSFPMTRLAYAIFPLAVANAIISGAFAFYVLYDVMHYALHHTKLPDYIKSQKIYHMAHHYRNSDLGYGVTSPF